MRYVNSDQMREIDRRTIDEFGIPSIVLMENAGRGAAEVAMDMLSGKENPKIVCICGRGNNGGDGFVAARHLVNSGVETEIFLIGEPSELKGDADINFRILKKMKVDVRMLVKQNLKIFQEKLEKYDLIIDAIFGIGLSRDVEGLHRSVINMLNSSEKDILSVDVPSGLDVTEGSVKGVCVKATKTVTFALPKTGFIKNMGPVHTGELITVDISVPKILLGEYKYA